MAQHDVFDDGDFYAPTPGNGSAPPAMASAAPAPVNALTAVEQSRAVAEVQAALVIAKSQPRDEIRADYKIKEACKRMSLAETAIYSYKRGTSQVEGPSIRLAEVMARYWGNLQYGFRELSREGAVSEVEAFCWDLETNTKATRHFQMKHWRDTKQGGYEIKDERDKYELIANYAQRRVRACILEIIPGDIVDGAMEQCGKTLKGNSEAPLKDRVKNMLTGFEALGVSAAMIEAKIQHNIDSITIYEFRQLAKLYTAIKDGYDTAESIFGPMNDLGKTAAVKTPGASPEEPKAEQPASEAKETEKKAPKAETKDKPKPEASDSAPVTRETLDAVQKELTRLGAPGQLPPDLVARYDTGDPSELSEPQGRDALDFLKGQL